MFTRSIRPAALSARSAQRAWISTTAVRLSKDIPAVSAVSPNELVSGAPAELVTDRTVRIYKPAKPATQSGNWGSRSWKIDWDIIGKANRWENDLIGYASTSDIMQSTSLSFNTKEDAIKFCEGQGWTYYIQEPKKRRFEPKSYADNFLHSKGPLKKIITK